MPSATVAVCWPRGSPPPPRSRHPPRAGPPEQPPGMTRHPPNQIPLNFPLGCWPGPDPPQLPPWLWAWRPPPHGQIPPNFPLGCGPGNLQGMLGYHLPRYAGIPPPPPGGQTDTCKNITFVTSLRTVITSNTKLRLRGSIQVHLEGPLIS